MLGRSINYDAFGPLVDLSKAARVRRFIYASSSSVYGLKDEPEVTEDLPLEPLTDYSRYKVLCEEILVKARAPGFEVLILRPATVCGYSPRQRLDVIVNIFTTQAITKGQIDVWGGGRVGRISTSRRWPTSICAAWRHLSSRSMARLSTPEGPTTPLPRSPALCGMRSASKSGSRPRTATTWPLPDFLPAAGGTAGLCRAAWCCRGRARLEVGFCQLPNPRTADQKPLLQHSHHAGGEAPMSLFVPYVDLVAQHQALRTELLEAVDQVLSHSQFVLGPEVGVLEAEVAALCGTSEAVAVNSGTDALVLALRVLGVGPGDEVITVPNSFVASASAIGLVGARPVFVDVGEDYNLDPAGLPAALTPRTRAILPVHLTGCPADMDPILSFARRTGSLSSRTAPRPSARHRGQRVGSLGDLGCFSLHPLKNLNACGDGGLITLNDPNRAARLRQMRNLGLVSRGVCGAWSGNSRFDTIQAAMLLVKLRHLPRWTARRRENAAFYRQALADLAEVRLPLALPDREAVYHTFVIQAERRDALTEHLAARGVGSAIHYPIPIHLQPCADLVLPGGSLSTDRSNDGPHPQPAHLPGAERRAAGSCSRCHPWVLSRREGAGMTRKLLDLDVLAARVHALRATGQRVVHCHGVFDLLHIGHIKHLEAARAEGDALAVTVTPDRFVNKGPHRPAFPEQGRARPSPHWVAWIMLRSTAGRRRWRRSACSGRTSTAKAWCTARASGTFPTQSSWRERPSSRSAGASTSPTRKPGRRPTSSIGTCVPSPPRRAPPGPIAQSLVGTGGRRGARDGVGAAGAGRGRDHPGRVHLL